MPRRVRLGVIVPSSNTVVEPLTNAIVSSFNDSSSEITVHFSRFRVTKIDLSKDTDSQFLEEPMVTAAQLLADARVDIIGWSGTSAGWLGFDRDENLCKAIETATGIPATTSTLALNKLLRLSNAQHVGLVTPYIKTVNDAIRENYASLGFDITQQREKHLDMTENAKFADISVSQLDGMVSDVAKQGANVVTTFCTNLRAAQRVAFWEEVHKITVLDSVATVIWDMLRLVSTRPSCIKGWGSMFEIDQQQET